MSLPTWLAAGWLQPHKTSRAEIRELWEIVDRDLADAASGGISADWQYGIAYNAALKLCTILLYAEGYKPPKGAMAHSRTLNALPHILGAQRQGDTDYLDGCRQKRNTVEYDHAGGASPKDPRNRSPLATNSARRFWRGCGKSMPGLRRSDLDGHGAMADGTT